MENELQDMKLISEDCILKMTLRSITRNQVKMWKMMVAYECKGNKITETRKMFHQDRSSASTNSNIINETESDK